MEAKEKMTERLADAQIMPAKKPSIMAKLSEKKEQAAEMAAKAALEKGTMGKARDTMSLA